MVQSTHWPPPLATPREGRGFHGSDEMGTGRSGMSAEEKHRAKVFSKMSAGARGIRDMEYEWLISYDDDGNEVHRHTDNMKSQVGYGTIDDWQYRVAGHRVVHNHPQGSTFSDDDLNMALYLKELWAVTGNRIQIFKWNHNWYDKEFPNRVGKMTEFIKKLGEMYAKHTFFYNAKNEYEAKHPVKELFSLKPDEFEKAMQARAQAVKELAIQRSREFLKNHQKEYGYTYNERKWK